MLPPACSFRRGKVIRDRALWERSHSLPQGSFVGPTARSGWVSGAPVLMVFAPGDIRHPSAARTEGKVRTRLNSGVSRQAGKGQRRDSRSFEACALACLRWRIHSQRTTSEPPGLSSCRAILYAPSLPPRSMNRFPSVSNVVSSAPLSL